MYVGMYIIYIYVDISMGSRFNGCYFQNYKHPACQQLCLETHDTCVSI